ncbi:MAG: ribosome maturation factor RimM [Alphaproteobacteria bacterium]|nr:ribosome maturation factor RimM [Alphaproteobacteria bacterium]
MQSKEAVSSPALILMAEIVGVHGVKGMLKVKVFGDDPGKLVDYQPLCDASGKKFSFLTFQPHQNIYLAALEGVSDRTAAEKLRGTKLYVPREALPQIKDKNTYYHVDLIGLTAKDADGAIIGKIIQVANFGAGDLLEIKPLQGASYYVPFTKAVVPNVDMAAREATVIVPHGLLD